jgi:hypothetical protein
MNKTEELITDKICHSDAKMASKPRSWPWKKEDTCSKCGKRQPAWRGSEEILMGRFTSPGALRIRLVLRKELGIGTSQKQKSHIANAVVYF